MNSFTADIYTSDIVDSVDSSSLSFATIRALEVIGHQTHLSGPELAYTTWALAVAAKARRLELSELWPGLFRPMIAMGAVVTEPSYTTAAALGDL